MVAEISGMLKRDTLGSNVLEDVEEELVLGLNLCSSSLSFLLLVSEVFKSASRGA